MSQDTCRRESEREGQKKTHLEIQARHVRHHIFLPPVLVTPFQTLPSDLLGQFVLSLLALGVGASEERHNVVHVFVIDLDGDVVWIDKRFRSTQRRTRSFEVASRTHGTTAGFCRSTIRGRSCS